MEDSLPSQNNKFIPTVPGAKLLISFHQREQPEFQCSLDFINQLDPIQSKEQYRLNHFIIQFIDVTVKSLHFSLLLFSQQKSFYQRELERSMYVNKRTSLWTYCKEKKSKSKSYERKPDHKHQELSKQILTLFFLLSKLPSYLKLNGNNREFLVF